MWKLWEKIKKKGGSWGIGVLRGVGCRGHIATGHGGRIKGRGQINRFLPFRLKGKDGKRLALGKRGGSG